LTKTPNETDSTPAPVPAPISTEEKISAKELSDATNL
jgi:hypothetical protein